METSNKRPIHSEPTLSGKTRDKKSTSILDAMEQRRCDRKQDRFGSKRSKLDPIPVGPKLTRLPAKFVINPHQKNKLQFNQTDTSSSKLDSLPHDLKLDILNRLPAKSLANLRCVSKMWSSIIRSPEFVRSFFSISSKRPPRLIVALTNGSANRTDEEKLIFLFSFSPDQSSSLVPKFEMAIPSVSFSSFSGSCTCVHGFLAVEADRTLSICNPCTEQYIKLPRGTTYVGYDPIDDQYKALSVQMVPRYLKGVCTTRLQQIVLTLGGSGGWRHIKPPTTRPDYTPISAGVSIDGFVYYGAFSPTQPMAPGVVCFDVRSEKLSYINAPPTIPYYGSNAVFIEYKGKLASIVVANPYGRFQRFDLWVLEDAQKHEWSSHICEIPLSLWDVVGCSRMSFPGTNKAGELIMAPTTLSHYAQPFYIFYYNVETKNIRTVRLLGIGDDQEFRRSYGFVNKSKCHVRISPQHIESIAFFKNPTT